MKKIILKSALLAVASVGLMSGSAMAIALSDSNLQDFFTTKGWNIDAANDQMENVAGWALTTGSTAVGSSFWLENPNDYIFGLYSTTGMEQVTIFDALDTPVASATVTFAGSNALVVQTLDAGGFLVDVDVYDFSGTTFGFFAEDTDTTIYSDKFLNDLDNDGVYGEDDDIGMLVYNADPGSYLFASDMDGSRSFSNMVTQAESMKPIPEPATMLLFGAGLITLAGINRKKDQKKA